MELLATNQPWNLIMFMAIPVILAETVAITELWILFTRDTKGIVRKINRLAGILGGIYFIWVFIHLMNTAFIPLTLGGLWRGPADFIAVSFYLLGVIPLAGISFLELGIIYKNKNETSKMKLHAILVGVFLLVAHIAMIFGMLNPEVLGFKENVEKHNMSMQME
jgi:hypothetical protein